MGSDRTRAKVKKSSSLIPGYKPKQFSFLQPRYQDQVETDSLQSDKQQAKPQSPLFSHSFGQMSVLPIQAKLTIGQPNDKYEQEADRVASQVVQQINAPSSAQSTQGQSIQRMDESEEEELQTKPIISPIQRSLLSQVVQRMNMPEEEEELQTKPQISAIQRSLLSPVVQRMDMPEEEEELQAKPMISPIQRSLISPVVQRATHPVELMLQRREAIASGEASADLTSAINSSRGGGQSLEPGLQESMGQAIGADFSRVRIHTDSQSDQLNQSIQAKAFTTGQDVFFRQGEYQPGSRGGQELIAHELTHVVQQGEGSRHIREVQRKLDIHDFNDEKKGKWTDKKRLIVKYYKEYNEGVSKGEPIQSLRKKLEIFKNRIENFNNFDWVPRQFFEKAQKDYLKAIFLESKRLTALEQIAMDPQKTKMPQEILGLVHTWQ